MRISCCERSAAVSPRRVYAPVVLGVLAAGGLAFLALGRTWARAQVASEGLPGDVVTVSGSDAHPLASALAVVVVTGAIAVLATGGRVRRGVGVLIASSSIGAIVAIAAGGSALDSTLKDAVAASPAFTGAGSVARSSTAWDLAAYAALAIAAVLGASVVALAPRWPTMSGRYEAPSATAAPAAPETEAEIWKALDEGRDPTE